MSHDDDDDDDKGGGREIMCARLTAASARNRKMVQILALVLGSTIHIIMEDYNIMEHIRDGPGWSLWQPFGGVVLHWHAF